MRLASGKISTDSMNIGVRPRCPAHSEQHQGAYAQRLIHTDRVLPIDRVKRYNSQHRVIDRQHSIIILQWLRMHTHSGVNFAVEIQPKDGTDLAKKHDLGFPFSFYSGGASL